MYTNLLQEAWDNDLIKYGLIEVVEALDWYKILFDYENQVLSIGEANQELEYTYPDLPLNILDIYQINCIFVNRLDMEYAISETINYFDNARTTIY